MTAPPPNFEEPYPTSGLGRPKLPDSELEFRREKRRLEPRCSPCCRTSQRADQDVEHLRFNGERLGAATKLAQLVSKVSLKEKFHVFGGVDDREAFQEIIKRMSRKNQAQIKVFRRQLRSPAWADRFSVVRFFC
jgi:hypothetical protein